MDTKMAAFLFSFGLIAGAGAQAEAGYKVDSEVYVGSSSASGALGSARTSLDTQQYIGCSSTASGSVTCFARNAAGTTKVCYSSTEASLDAVRSLGGDAYLHFSVDVFGICTSIKVEHASYYEPK